ncbi:hypothetical protein NB311A_08899 [Nitrobacter sp. Nb-311A]|nr:hypothetical protein NB311A_08899 [Nitrobacter sp. Nb-311A]
MGARRRALGNGSGSQGLFVRRSSAAAITNFFLPLRFVVRIIFLCGLPDFGLSDVFIPLLLNLRPLASVLLMVGIFLVYGHLVRISRIRIWRVRGTRVAGRPHIIGSRRWMATVRVLVHVFAHTRTRFGIVAHWKRSFFLVGCRTKPARLEHVPKELLFLRYG